MNEGIIRYEIHEPEYCLHFNCIGRKMIIEKLMLTVLGQVFHSNIAKLDVICRLIIQIFATHSMQGSDSKRTKFY